MPRSSPFHCLKKVYSYIDQRRQYFESKRDRLYEVELFYVIVLEGARSTAP